VPIHHAVLSLLSHGPSHGYQLKGDFEATVGPQWGPLNIGHLYQVLDRLARDGMVSSERRAQAVKPDRVVYSITGAGRDELARWLGEAGPRTSGFRDDFFLKVTAAARTGAPDVVRGVLTRQRTQLLRELRNLDGLRRKAEDPVVGLLLSGASRHVEADLAFVDEVEAALLADGARLLSQLSRGRAEPGPAGEISDAAAAG
jgi:DNA-binding PadR family transcriptional regulator